MVREKDTGAEIHKKRTWKSTWYPSTEDLNGANDAAQQTAYAFGAICFGYILVMSMEYFNAGDSVTKALQPDLTIYTKVANGLIVLFTGYLAWRCYKKPGLYLSIFCLLWVLSELYWKIEALRSASLANYWLQILAAIWAINGIRGTVALRRFKKNQLSQLSIG